MIKDFLKQWKKDKTVKKSEEKEHREPIVVRIFSEDSKTNKMNISVEEVEEEKKENKHHFESNHKYFIICIYAIGFVAIAGLMIYGIMNLSALGSVISGFLSVLSPFIIAGFIAFIMNPIVYWLEGGFFKKVCKIKQSKLRILFSVIVSYAFVITLIVLGLRVVLPQTATSISELYSKLPDMLDDMVVFIESLQERFPTVDFDYIQKQISDMTPEIISTVTNVVKNVLPMLLTISVSILKTMINLLLAVAISIYMICDKRRLARMFTSFLYAIMPSKRASNLIVVSKESTAIFGGFIIGKTIDSLIIGILCFIIMSIIQLPYAVLLSVIVGVTNMIPYFGPFIGAVPGILLYLCISPVLAFVFAVMILILQQFDGWFLGPKILGDSTGLRPLWVIFAITVGGGYFGVLGMFLGVPVTAVIAHLVNKWVVSRLAKKKIDIS